MRRLVLWGIVLGAAACGPSEPGVPEAVVLSGDEARDMEPIPSPDGAQIAFLRPNAGGSELWVANADMSNARSLGVTTNIPENGAIWSPDGQYLAVSASMRNAGDIVTVRASDGEVDWVAESPNLKVPLQFHPDGDRLVFAALSGGSISTFAVSRSTREVQPLVPDLTVPHIGRISPDGSTILIQRFDRGASTIWRADAVGGGNQRQLTTEGFEELFLTTEPFSPDGSQVLYTSRRTGKRDVWSVNVADGTTRQLTTEIQDDYDPVWSPDGQWVAFLSNRGRQTDIWVVPATGGEAVRVTDNRAAEAWVRWVGNGELSFSVGDSPGSFWTRSLADGAETRLSPDSLDVGDFSISHDRQRLAFLIDLPGEINDLGFMPAGGGAIETLARGAHHTNIQWSPDGARVAYTSDQAGSLDTWLAEPGSGAAPRQLTDWLGGEQVLGWSPDGSAVYIQAERESALGDLWSVPIDGSDPQRVTTLGNVGFGMVSPRQQPGEILVVRIESGVQTVARVNADGSITPLTRPADGNMGGLMYSPDGSNLVMVSVAAGGFQGRVIRTSDWTTVATLPANTFPASFSMDGRRLAYSVNSGVGNAADLGILDLASGETTEVTATPESEPMAAFTADGNALILRRVKITERVMRADVSGVLRAAAP